MKVVCTGKGSSMSLPKVCSHVIELSQKAKPHVLYLGTPSFDDQSRFEIQTAGFKKAGCSIMKMDLSEVPRSKNKPLQEGKGPISLTDDIDKQNNIVYPVYETMKQEVHNADIIMVSGGNTLYGMQRWQTLGMDRILKEASNLGESSPVFCGGSAGAICWFDYGNSDSMNPSSFLNPDPNLTDEEKNNWDYIKISGLGFLPALCVPHYDVLQHNGIYRSMASETMVREMSDFPCIGIEEDAAFVVDGDDVRVIDGDNNGAKCYKKEFCSQVQKMEMISMEESHGNFSLTKLLHLN
jgi:dipeptidase E